MAKTISSSKTNSKPKRKRKGIHSKKKNSKNKNSKNYCKVYVSQGK